MGSRKFWNKVLLFLTVTSTLSLLRWVSYIPTMSWYLVAASNFSVWSLLSFFANPLRLYEQIRKEEMVFVIQEENMSVSFTSPTWFFWVLIYLPCLTLPNAKDIALVNHSGITWKCDKHKRSQRLSNEIRKTYSQLRNQRNKLWSAIVVTGAWNNCRLILI